MADSTYSPKVYRKQGGNELVVASGGSIDVESGGSFKLAGTSVSATAAQLNFVSGVTAGTGAASKALVLNSDLQVEITATRSSGAGSFQPIAVDLKTGGGVGAAGKKIAPIMGNVIDLDTPAALTQKNIVGGLIGAYSITVDNQSTYPGGAVCAQISDAVNDTSVFGVVSYIDGDSGTTKCGAMFKVMCNNSTAASGADFGLDLQDAAHDGYIAVDRAFYKKAPVRLVDDVVVFTNAGAPVNGTTLDNVAGKGSLCVDVTNGELYINTGTITDSTWVKVGTQS